jgi:hypothetical protein
MGTLTVIFREEKAAHSYISVRCIFWKRNEWMCDEEGSMKQLREQFIAREVSVCGAG